MKWVSNLPDGEHIPFEFIDAEPNIKTVARYLRTSDYASMAAVAVGFPTAFYAWERFSPSINPRKLPRIMVAQIPFYACAGVLYGFHRSIFRFWGWSENSIEVKRWKEEQAQQEA
ncbi:hypothetical protein BASA50_008047 [Batrachochytrium salamandrivorans]|uniref:NADH-ubiquinone oxidoreductase 21kDa subunit N-terminal domain-containing protein n=1 Tax=Batrachochytrium salamandrivorans TaxID=1357716 RepID=A0ABQ8F548_9FUNG|nr:hypothetical protein BASA62_006430 [Batrachochytrium salamandrivorans]KAH6584376.1 hypothetical protein BASA60_001007 [Batrachochytrium salamandrivorans]KAH6588469.1 hypothetical protein BASA61_005924 [Batrachochytrium salamandrivorans]KAH6592431.1 hypothetical protein BASA50_008047 [Batrachochytrium salamandrivorans]KAH9245122.1 hypothetical protein BASA81_017416 [Batrachochytrium salamandrivorans]